MLKRTVTCFALLLTAWIIVSGIFSQNELGADGYLKFGLPLSIYSDYNGKASSDLVLGFHLPNILITLSALVLLSVTIAYMVKRPLST